jgi:5-formyltetrahydrofolate cyclo-ligase
MQREKKQDLRRQMREALARMTPEERAAESTKLWRDLQSQPRWMGFGRVLAFVPLPEEPQLLDLLLESCRTVAVPRICGVSMEFCRITSRSELVAHELPGKNKRILWEPGPACEPILPANNDVTLVPGLAFTSSGLRLGRGGGFYDRFLQTFPGTAWGVCFSKQLVPTIPTEPHDIHMNGVFHGGMPG